MALIPFPSMCRHGHLVRRIVLGHNAYVLFFSLASRQAFEGIGNWRGFVERRARLRIHLLAIIGTRVFADEVHEVSSEEGRALAEQLGAEYLETVGAESVPALVENALAGWVRRYDQLKQADVSTVPADVGDV